VSDFIIMSGDSAIFNPAFSPAIVTVQPGTITGSAQMQIQGSLVCVSGDEASVVVAGCPYNTPSFPTPGVGTLTITALGGDQMATQTKSGQKAVILKGSTFTARFSVTVPATLPGPPPTPDSLLVYSGTGQFVTTNAVSKGT
jgi:hypothetical protein